MVEPENHDTASRILDSVMHLILQGGLGAVTLSAVCKHANISKGGLVYHFPTKESMVDAFVRRSSEQYLEIVSQAISKLPAGRGRQAKAFVDLFLASPQSCVASADGSCEAVMVALIQGGEKSLHGFDHYQPILRQLQRDGLTLGTAELIVATIDGIWLQSLIQPSETMVPRSTRIRKQLRKMIDLDIAQRRHKLEKDAKL